MPTGGADMLISRRPERLNCRIHRGVKMKEVPERGLFGLCLRAVYKMLTGSDPARQTEIGRAILAIAEADPRPEVQEVAGQLKAELERRDA